MGDLPCQWSVIVSRSIVDPIATSSETQLSQMYSIFYNREFCRVKSVLNVVLMLALNRSNKNADFMLKFVSKIFDLINSRFQLTAYRIGTHIKIFHLKVTTLSWKKRVILTRCTCIFRTCIFLMLVSSSWRSVYVFTDFFYIHLIADKIFET